MMQLECEPTIELASFLLPDETPRARGKILIADDESRIRLALRGCLEAEGYEVEEARDGAEAIRVILDTRPDVMLLDLAMPRLDGMSALRQLHARYREMMPRTIVLTAWGTTPVEEEAFLLNVSAFLHKPLVPEALRNVVERVLHQPPAVDQDDEHDYKDPDEPFGLYLG